MFTLILALIHSRAKNKEFRPEFLYFATFILDYVLIFGMVSVLGG